MAARSNLQTAFWIPFSVPEHRARDIAFGATCITGRNVTLRRHRLPGRGTRYSLQIPGFLSDSKKESLRSLLEAQRPTQRTPHRSR